MFTETTSIKVPRPPPPYPEIPEVGAVNPERGLTRLLEGLDLFDSPRRFLTLNVVCWNKVFSGVATYLILMLEKKNFLCCLTTLLKMFLLLEKMNHKK